AERPCLSIPDRVSSLYQVEAPARGSPLPGGHAWPPKHPDCEGVTPRKSHAEDSELQACPTATTAESSNRRTHALRWVQPGPIKPRLWWVSFPPGISYAVYSCPGLSTRGR